tara:strand:+ start:9050 stop:10129 length:1080 start_codon:yes stop_codon:yes gene_type:complete
MYTRFQDNDIVTRQAAELVTSTWSNNTNNLTVGFTSSAQANFSTSTSSGHFYIEVSDKVTSDPTSEVQYALSYGHRAGSGSPDFTNDTGSFGLGASRVIYNQYRQLMFNDDTKFFTFGSHTPDDIFVINVNRSRYKQRLTLGSLNLTISGSSIGSVGTTQTEIHLTDDSVTNGEAGTSQCLGPYYNIVSGSSGVLLGTSTSQLTISAKASTYGLFFPESGIIILNGDSFVGAINPATNPGITTNTDKNHEKLLRHISEVGNEVGTGNTGSFIIDTTEEINSQFYFTRCRNDQFNYTNNESFVDNNKNIRFETMKLNPKVFITTVGLYNDAFELLAIAKLSQPVAKDFTKEALIRVKLDY